MNLEIKQEHPECEGCIMNIKSSCFIQDLKRSLECPCANCLVKVICKNLTQMCFVWKDFYNDLKRIKKNYG